MFQPGAGIDQVLYGTDFPYLRRDLAVNAKQRILESAELSDLEKDGILGTNDAPFSAPGFLHSQNVICNEGKNAT